MMVNLIYGPDYDGDDGDSDDNAYEEYMAKYKLMREQAAQKTEAEKRQALLKSIFSAISYSREDTVFEEFDKGLDINVDLDLEWTPLLLAATTANVFIFSGFIQRDANINQTRDGGMTALMYLCSITSTAEDTEENIVTCVKLLIEKNVDVHVIDNKRRTAIMLAAYYGHLETVKVLLPLVDKNTVDNQSWDVLFWAVDGNQLQVVQYLLGDGFSCVRTDVRGNTVVDLAHNNGFTDILELFPKDPFDEFYSYLNTNELTFEEIFNTPRPQFFNDICKILYGTKSEFVMATLRDKKITLGEFLSLNDSKLQELGVKFPFQRARILDGLYRFHKHPFKPQSIPFVKKDQLYSNIDVSMSVLTCIKQTIAMEASFKFMLENGAKKFNLVESKEADILLAKVRHQLERLKMVTDQLEEKTEQWDLKVKPVDRITKLRRNIRWGDLCLAVGILSVFLIYKFK